MDTAAAFVAKSIDAHLGERPESVEAVAGSRPHVEVFRARLPTRSVVFKADVLGESGRVVLEAWACQRARELGALVPRVLAVDLARETYPRHFILLEDIDGVPLPDAGVSGPDLERVMRAAGSALRRVHEIGVPGFGLLDEATYLETARVQGGSNTWEARLLGVLEDVLPALVNAGVLSGAGAGRVESFFAEHTGFYDIGPVGHLLHGSFDPYRILVKDGELAAIVDFGDRQSGDPAWEFGSFLVRNVAAVGPLLVGYRATKERAASMEVTIPLFAVLRGLESARNALLHHDLEDCDRLLDAAFLALSHLWGS